MYFRILSGDIDSDYTPSGNTLVAPGKPTILVNEATLANFLQIKCEKRLYHSKTMAGIGLGVGLFIFGLHWPVIVLALLCGFQRREVYTFRMDILGVGTMVAEADTDTYKAFLEAVVSSA